jgi:hypothetical protein
MDRSPKSSPVPGISSAREWNDNENGIATRNVELNPLSKRPGIATLWIQFEGGSNVGGKDMSAGQTDKCAGVSPKDMERD